MLRPPNQILDPVLHQPVRTRLVAFLAGRGEATFNEIKQAMDLTDGNLDSHIKKLTAARYLTSRKEDADGRPQTFYSLSKLGNAQFRKYVSALHDLLDFA